MIDIAEQTVNTLGDLQESIGRLPIKQFPQQCHFSLLQNYLYYKYTFQLPNDRLCTDMHVHLRTRMRIRNRNWRKMTGILDYFSPPARVKILKKRFFWLAFTDFVIVFEYFQCFFWKWKLKKESCVRDHTGFSYSRNEPTPGWEGGDTSALKRRRVLPYYHPRRKTNENDKSADTT